MYSRVQLVIYAMFVASKKGAVRGRLAIPDISLVDVTSMSCMLIGGMIKGVAVGAQETCAALVAPEARAMP